MLRQNFTKVITSPQLYNKVFRISFLLALIGLLCVPFVPIMGEAGFISENAVSATNPLSLYDVNRTFKIHKALQAAIAKNDNSTLSFIENFFLKNNVKPHRVDFTVESITSKGKSTLKGTNLYGIYHTKRGDPAECNLITFNHDLSSKDGDGKLEIALALSFLEMFVDTNKVNYNSRDLIFLAYDGRFKTYGRAIQEFLEDYYTDRADNRERCGVIRQAMNIEIDKDDFNRIAFRYQGINARVPDLDYYVLFTKLLDTFAGNVWDLGFNTTQESKINTFLSKNYYQHISSTLKNIKPNMIRPFDATTTIHSMKGLLVGWPHEVHTYLLEKGIMAVTLKGYKCENCQVLRAPAGMLEAMGKVIEGANRGCQALQEQLHAASTAWIATGKKNVYFIFGGLTFVILMLLPQILKAVINFYEHGLGRNVLRAGIEHTALILTLGVLYELPRLFEAGWSLITGEHVQICSPYSVQGGLNNNTFLLAFLATALLITFFGTVILPNLLFKLFPADEIKPYQVHQWNTKYVLATGYIAIIMILWSLSNPVFAFIGTIFAVPVFLCISPFQKPSPKRLVGNVVGILCLAGWGLLITHVIAEAGYNWIEMAREVLMREACVGTDFYKFIVLYIVPCLVFIGQILVFRGQPVKRVHID